METLTQLVGKSLLGAGALAFVALAIPAAAASSSGPEAGPAVDSGGCADPDMRRISDEPGWHENRSKAVRTPAPSLARGAQVGKAEIVPEGLVRELVGWIGAHTDYDVSKVLARPPLISFAGEGTRIGYEGRELDLGPTLRATYDAYSRDIYVKCPWNAADPLDLSTLLHELIHDVQYQNLYWPCPRDAEWEAYQLQVAWLEERGERLGFNWLPAVLLSGCLRDVHP